MKEQVSTGERFVFCDKADCAFTGDEVSDDVRIILELPGRVWYVCEADIVVLDRRPKFGKVCARFARRMRDSPREPKGG